MANVSNYPGGFANGITIRGVPLQILHPGNVYWVNNSSVLAKGAIGGSDGNDGTYTRPFSTLDYAIGKCTASRGDVIVLMPGHIENITAASGITVDVAGIAIVGLGAGTLRPRIDFEAAAATYVISAANVSHYNVEFQANFSDVTMGLDISGVDGLSFDSCYFTEAGTDLNFIGVVDLATGADDISFVNCKFITNDIANTSHINGVAHSGFYVDNCIFYVNAAQSVVTGLIATSGNTTNMEIKNCSFRSNVDGALFLDFNGTANSGCITWNMFSSIDTAGAVTAGHDVTGAHVFENYVAGEADSYGLVGGGTVYNNA